MTLTLQSIESIAPDQASLSSAKKLLLDSKWQGQGFCENTHTAWGECQGSGSKPYYVVVDVSDMGYKCTCPSRKFPCKHALALMWRYVNDPSPFLPSATPDWVANWLGRRRKTTKSGNIDNNDTKPKKSLALTDTDESDQAIDLKKAESAKKRAEKVKATTDAQISTGLHEFVGWLDDQIRLGMGAFMDHASKRCRQICARLVDAKAGGLASMVDEFPPVLFNTPKADRASVAFGAFGRWYLLCQAWQKNPDDPDVRRAITRAENKDSLIQEPFLAVVGVWQVVGERIHTRKDGLISHAIYLVKMANDTDSINSNVPNTAVLLDFYHPTSGFRPTGGHVGSLMVGRLIYYPSRVPCRAFFETVKTKEPITSVFYYDSNTKNDTPNLSPVVPQMSKDNLRTAYAKQLNQLPWANELFHMLGKGYIAKDKTGRFWYLGDETIRLANADLPPLVQSCDIQHAFIVWDGVVGELLSVQTIWGLLTC
ncbi:MAG: SWIM zinc finger family protein [Moraxella sp.]|nr:SWIM zinc finger family protein [Moraxella sp.]